MVVAPELPTFSRAPTITLEGWRSFVDSEPLDMTPLPTSDLETLTPARHELYDEQRISYHSELVIVQTSTARSIIHQGRLLTMLNQREVSARRGLVVSGPWASGKTPPSNSSERPTSCGSGAATRARIVSPSSISLPRPKAPRGSWPASSRTSSASPSDPGTTSPTLPTPSARS